MSFGFFGEWDRLCSARLAQMAFSPIGKRIQLRAFCMAIEWTMHGIPWLIGSLMFVIWSRIYGWSEEQIRQADILLTGLLVDLIAVGLVKIVVRRKRPEYNKDDQIYEAPIADKFAFPSGHSARAAMLFALFPSRWHFWLPFVPLLAISRVLMGRHYISDVFAGLLLGKLEAIFVLALSHREIDKFLTEFLNLFYTLPINR